MQAINNVPTRDSYDSALTLEDPGATLLAFTIANNSALAQLRGSRRESGGDQSYGEEILLDPQRQAVPNTSGVKFKSAVPGAPARVIATLVGPQDPQLAAGIPFASTLLASGQVVSQGITQLFARSTADLVLGNGGGVLVPGLSVDVEIVGANATYEVIAACGFESTAAGFGIALADITLDGGGVGTRGIWQDNGLANQFASPIASAGGALGVGPHTFRLLGSKTLAGGNVLLALAQTSLVILIKDA